MPTSGHKAEAPLVCLWQKSSHKALSICSVKKSPKMIAEVGCSIPQGQILAVWILAAKLLISDLNFLWIFWWLISSWFFQGKRPPPKKIHAKFIGRLGRKNSLGFLQKPTTPPLTIPWLLCKSCAEDVHSWVSIGKETVRIYLLRKKGEEIAEMRTATDVDSRNFKLFWAHTFEFPIYGGHKQLSRDCPGVKKFVYVLPFSRTRRETLKQNPQEVSGKFWNGPGTIP